MASRSQILGELRQSKPLASAAEEALLGLLRTTDLLRRQGNDFIEPYGISSQQYNVLRILRGAGPKGLPTLDVADRLVERTPGITRLLDRLEKKKLIRRQRRAEDRRQVFCWITPEGLDLLGSLDAPLQERNRKALKMLSAKELRTLIQLLDRIRKPG